MGEALGSIPAPKKKRQKKKKRAKGSGREVFSESFLEETA
jgi:hypothetical protein